MSMDSLIFNMAPASPTNIAHLHLLIVGAGEGLSSLGLDRNAPLS
jgi:hypothetical protein